jgi:HSP20 family protein
MDLLRRELDRVFDSYSGGRSSAPFHSVFLPGRSARSYPLVNMYEDEDAVYLEALAPGLDADSLDVSIHNKTLTISGEKPAAEDVEADAYHRNERSAGRFVRTVTVDTPVAPEHVSADYEDGILTVSMPKSEEAKPKQISVNVK